MILLHGPDSSILGKRITVYGVSCVVQKPKMMFHALSMTNSRGITSGVLGFENKFPPFTELACLPGDWNPAMYLSFHLSTQVSKLF